MSVWDEPWALRHERRLLAKLQPRLPRGESARRVAQLFDGAPPDLVGMAEDMLLQRATLGLVRSRKYFTLLLTDERLIMIANVTEKTPGDMIAEYPLGTGFGAISVADGDNWVDIAGHRYWYWPKWKQQLLAIKGDASEHGSAEG